MKKIYLITTLVLLFAISVAAQQGKPATQSAGSNAPQAQAASPQTAPAAKEETTIQGCLAAAGSSFTLTDKSGKAYQLEGDSSKLTSHVGHEVQLTGTEAAGDATATAAPTVFTVKKVKMMASTCSTK